MADNHTQFSGKSKERGLSQEDNATIALRQHEVYDTVYVLLSAVSAIDPELVRDIETPATIHPATVSEKTLPTEMSGNVIQFAAARDQVREAEAAARVDAARRLAQEAHYDEPAA